MLNTSEPIHSYQIMPEGKQEKGQTMSERTKGDTMNLLSSNHWTAPNYRQRMTSKEWKKLLLDGRDQIIVGGELYVLKAKRLGAGVVEVYKTKWKEPEQ